MKFSLKQLTSLNVDVKYAPEIKATKKEIHKAIAESLEKSTIKRIKGLAVESLGFFWALDDIEETIDSVPFISLTKGDLGIRISRDGFSLRIPYGPRRAEREPGKPIIKSVLREASGILNRVLLSHAGITKKTAIETTVIATYMVESKAKNLVEVLNAKCIDSIRKKGFEPSLNAVDFSFKDEQKDQVTYSVRTRLPAADPSKSLKEDHVELRCSSIGVGPLEGLDLISKVDDLASVCKQVSSALGV